MDLLYRPLDLETIKNPHPIYDRLRTEAPVLWHDQTRSWVLSRYEDCRFVLTNHYVFARDQRRVGMKLLSSSQDNMQVQDPPTLTEFRLLLSDAFKRQDLSKIISASRSRLEVGVLQRSPNAPFDFMSDVATDVALHLSLQLIGAAENCPSNYHAIFEGIARQMDSKIDSSRSSDGIEGTAALRSLMESWLAAPTSVGLIGALRGKLPSRKFDNDYVRNTMCGVFNACYSTLYAITGSVFLVMLQNRHLMKLLGQGVATDVAAQELIRYISPAQGSTRHAVAPIEIGNKKIQRGDAVITLFSAANRDPDKFYAPAEIMLQRSPNPHIGFGWGSHFCIGASVASAWVRELLSFLQANHEMLTLVGEPTYMNLATLRCLKELNLTANSETGGR